MDDNSFDKYIKDRVEGFQDNKIDEGALAGLHARMDAVNKVPWYSGYSKVAVYTTAVVLISMLNYGIFTLLHDRTPVNGARNSASNNALVENNSYDALRKDFEVLKETKSRVDTVYIYRTVYKDLMEPSESIESTNDFTTNKNGTTYKLTASKIAGRSDTFFRGNTYPTQETIDFLLQNNLAFINQDGAIVLINGQAGKTINNRALKGTAYKELRTSVLPNNKVAKVPTPKIEEIHFDRKVKLSARTLNAIEKFKMSGVGFQYGPEIDLFKLSTNDRVGNPGFSAGLMGEFILSPSWRVETGVKYTYAGYKIDDTQDLGEDLKNFPNINTELGELNQIEQKSHLLAFPVHLKYQHPISEKRAVFASFGLSPQLYLLQKFEYEYMFPVSTDDGVFISEIESPNKVKENKFYTGTYDFSLGFERKLDNKSLLQLSAFYSRSAGGLGVENRKLDLIGLRSSIRFRVK